MKKDGKLTGGELKKRFELLKTDRSTWESHWQEIAKYIQPNRADFRMYLADGTKRHGEVLDNTAIQSNELLAGALHGLLTSPNTLWFELTTGNQEIDNMDGVRSWLQKQTITLHNLMNNSNFQTEVHQYYLDLTSFGTAPMSIEEDDELIVRFAARHLKEIYVAENNKGYIDEVYREFKWNVRQIIGEFGDEVLSKSRHLAEAFRKSDDQKFTIIHGVYPRKLHNTDLNDRRRYHSQYILCEHDNVELSEKYFREFPYVVARWTKASGEVYGRSPGMIALPDAKTINVMTDTVIRGAQRAVDPPLQLPDDGFIMPINTRPAGLNYYRAGSSDRITPVFNDTRIDFGFETMNERRGRIRDAFYMDQLQLGQGPQMTATEVLQRTEERMRLLGPMLGRQQAEFLKPLIERVYDIASRRKNDRGEPIIDPAPEVLQGTTVSVTYSSMIAKTQRINEGQNIARTMQAIAPFVTSDQSVLDNFDGDKAVRSIAKIYGFPQEILRDLAQIQGMREQRAAAQQEQMAAAQEQQQLETLGKAGPGLAKIEELSQPA